MSEKKRLLNDLRVIDIRAELEKRNLDKSGVRGVLLQRLAKHLEEEGLDPATFLFEITTPEPKTPAKRTRRSESTKEQESEPTPAMEDMVVQDDVGEEDSTQPSKSDQEAEEQNENEGNMEVEESKISRKRESKDAPEVSQAKKPCIVKENTKTEEDHKLENNLDTEDSINLDIGDDELLNEESDNTAKKKDDAEQHETAEPEDEEIQPDAAVEEADQLAAGEQVNTEAAPTSNDMEKTDEQKDEKEKEDDSDKKEKKEDAKEGGARNLWVSGLSGDTRARDLKQLCSKHGKVIGAKVVTNARTPGSRCYGYVTMASSQDAENCIKNLHKTELHGRMISVEKAKSESESTRRQPVARPTDERTDDAKENEEDKEGGDKNDKPKKDGDASGAESARSASRTRERSRRSDKEKGKRSSKSRERRRSPREVLSFSKIWKERDEARVRERSRAAREEERRRRAAEDALRERERRQRQEKHRLEIEREKLRVEREKIEREKNDLLRLERERHRLEREKLEIERLELKRAQLRLEEERRKRGYEAAGYRKPAGSPPPDAYERDARHKRPPPPAMPRHAPTVRTQTARGAGQFEAPPPPRFEVAAGAGAAYERERDRDRDRLDKRDRDRDYKRDYQRHVSATNMKYTSNGAAGEERSQPLPPGTRPKEPSRAYESREPRAYRSPPAKPEPRAWNASARYPDQPPANKGGSGGEAWSGAAGAGERYGYEARYAGAPYQPPPPGAAYPDRYAPPARDYRKY